MGDTWCTRTHTHTHTQHLLRGCSASKYIGKSDHLVTVGIGRLRSANVPHIPTGMWMGHPHQASRLQGPDNVNCRNLADSAPKIGRGWQQSRQNGTLLAVIGCWSRMPCDGPLLVSGAATEPFDLLSARCEALSSCVRLAGTSVQFGSVLRRAVACVLQLGGSGGVRVAGRDRVRSHRTMGYVCCSSEHLAACMWLVRIELTTLGLWDLRAANCATAT